MEVRAPMEMNMGKFSEKLVGLLELAKKKNVLEYQEISDYFKTSHWMRNRWTRSSISWRQVE